MNSSTVLTWENRLTRLSLIFLLGATAYGVFAGATVTMYYEVVPNMGAIEDSLGSVQFGLYLLAIFTSFVHLPLALLDARHSLWKQASIRGLATLGPLVVFLGTDGLLAHFLWWFPISETDRFHLLHHSLFAGVPLTFSYWLLLRWLWQPATFTPVASPSVRAWVMSGILVVWIALGFGILMGVVSPIVFGATAIAGLIAISILWRMASHPSA